MFPFVEVLANQSIGFALLFFAVGIILVIKGGDWFVDSASHIAKMLGVPSFLIGATIVSLATTMPEMIVSVMSAAEGRNEMAIGNAVGSVTANSALIMALSMIFLPIIAKRGSFIVQSITLIAVTAVLWVGCLNGRLSLWAGVLLALAFLFIMGFNINQGKKMAALEKKEEKETFSGKDIVKDIFFFLLGAAAIVIGSDFLVDGGCAIATKLGVDDRVIAVTMVAIGTSLPELVTAITAIRKKEAQLSVGNIIGANIIDISLILPICSVVSKGNLVVSSASIVLDFPFCLLVCLVALVPMMLREKAYKWQGILNIVLFAGYVIWTCFFI